MGDISGALVLRFFGQVSVLRFPMLNKGRLLGLVVSRPIPKACSLLVTTIAIYRYLSVSTF